MRKLKLLIAACALMVSSAVNAQTWTTGAEVGTGDFYLYNIGSGTFLNCGLAWGTHATLDGAGKVINIAGSDGAYTLHMATIASNKFIANEGYVDAASNEGRYTTWTFESATADGYTNVYKLKANNGEKYLYWAGGGSGQYNNEARTGTENVTNDLWLLIPKAERESTDGASDDTPVDVTYLIKNPDMEADDHAAGEASNDWSGDQNFVKQFNNGSMSANFLERWWGQYKQDTGADDCLNDFDTHQTLKNLPTGKYRLTVTAAAEQQNAEKANAEGFEPTGIYLYAGENTTAIKALNTYSVDFDAVGEDINVGVKTVSTNVNWVRFDNVRLYFRGVDLTLLKQTYQNALAAVENYDLTKPMSSTAKDNLGNAKTTYASVAENATALNEAITALTNAVNDADASVTAYASLKAAIAKVEDAIKTTNVYDAALFASIKQGYDDRSISTADASDLGNGGSWGDARYKSIYTKVLAANWKIGDKLATENGSGLYQNTWSTEGNTDGTGMTTPFMEYWVGDGDALAANTISNTVTGLDADGTYAISLLVRVRQQNNQTKANDDVTLSLNGGDAINMADGSVANNNAFFYKTITATANADAEGKIAIAINVKEGNHISWLAFKNVSYMNLSEVIAEFNQLKQDATTLMNNNAVVTGTEKTNLSNAIDASPSGMEGYSNAITALQDAIDAFSAAIPNYQAFDAEKTIAQELGVSDIPSPTTGAEAQAAVNQLKVNEYNYVTETYTSDVTSVLPAWTLTNIAGDTKGQHWSGDGNKAYFDRWNSGAITSTVSATYNLPAGQYAFYAAGRGQAGKSTAKLTMTIGEDTKEISYVMKGDTGFGIDKTGKANFTAGEDTYANNNNGRGWEWRFITFELSDATDVTFSAVSTENGSWASFSDLTLATTSDNTGIIQQMIAKEVKNAEDLRDNAANVGTGVFQIPSSAVEELNSAISVANSTSSISDVESAISALQQAEADFRNAELNAPADGQLFNVVLTYGGWTYDQKAMTYLAGDRADMGGYNIKYNAPANENLAQAFTFTKVEGNNYKMSQIDADGNVRYMCTGVPYGGNTSQIRTTTNAEDAMLVTVIPTATEGVWNLKNTEANNFIGSQDAGVYTVNSHIDFNIVETTKPSIAINTTAYGTTMLPFAAELPSGVKAYTCAAIDGATLTLVEVTALEANKPYIIEGTWNETVTGDAQGTALNYTEGLLTGVYAETAAPVGSYVLQSQNDVTGFYKVAQDKQPNVPANHAYLTATSTARALYFDNATAIRAIEVLTSGEAEIYNAAGARQNSLQKGVNIIKQGNKTFKVMVK